MVRFCDDCCQEKQTDWSDYFRVRLCMDCYNDRCEAQGEPPVPVDDGSCDPLYGQHMDSANCGEC